MTTRALAAAFLAASALLATLAITVGIAARLLQIAIVVSVAYVAYLAWRGWRVMRRARVSGVLPDPLPWITLVVPARDEAGVIGELLADLVAVDYGTEADGPRFDVVVVDDGSTDGTGEVAASFAGRGPALRVLRREPGSGPPTKGAVLDLAMGHSRGDVVGIIDADARVGPGFLAGVVGAWARDPGAAALQVLRRPLNAGHSWLTKAQAEEQLMDMASQCGRWATDGTAELRGNGMFVRRGALDAAGGWAPLALTEDLELSTRLAVGGRHVGLAPEVEVGEEAVETLAALWRQRLRWAEGSLRRLLEHGPRLLTSGIPLSRKSDFLAFTAEFLVPPLFVAATVASLLTIPLPQPADWTVPVSLFISYGVGTFLLALGGLAADGRRGMALVAGAARGALFLSHWLLVVPVALLRIAFWRPTVAFRQTPRRRRPVP